MTDPFCKEKNKCVYSCSKCGKQIGPKRECECPERLPGGRLEVKKQGGMSIPTEALEKAIGAGWKHYPYRELHTVYKIALDPLFWQALGKALGWHQHALCVPTKEGARFYGERTGQIIGESRDGESWRVRWLGNRSTYTLPKYYIRVMPRNDNWPQHAHRFYDLILTGGDTEKFWEEALK